ncbi:MAG: glycine zipper 2TM domain-containing protein [Pseudomonadota bacterium]
MDSIFEIGHSPTPAPVRARRLHPLLTAAAVSLTVFSLLGIGAITGLIPSASSQLQEKGADKDAAKAEEGGKPAAKGAASAKSTCANCGVVETVRMVQLEGNASGLGAVAGGVTGALVGNQFGRGGGNTAMTLIGAAGGAYAGNSIEKNMNRQTAYRITVRMDDGAYRTISQSHVPAVAAGDKVKVVNGNVSAIP